MAQATEVTRVVGDGQWLTVGEAARLMGVSEWKVRRLAADGTLESTKVPGSTHRRISRASAEAHKLGGTAAPGKASDA